VISSLPVIIFILKIKQGH